MSEKIFFGFLDTLELLLFLSPKKYITSKIIRKKFNKIPSPTLRSKLKKLVQQGFIKKKIKAGDFAGDDRTEFKLTVRGVDMRNRLVKRGVEVLFDVIEKIVEEKSAKESP